MIWRKVALKLKWSWNDFIRSKPSFERMGGEIRVLCFHGICSDDQPYINGRFLKEGRLQSLLKTLKEKCHIISYAEFDAGILQKDKLNILLTFDDAYLNNKAFVLPCIEELEVPILLFATSNQDGFWMDLLDIVMAKPELHRRLQEIFPAIKEFSNGELKRWMMKQTLEEQTAFRNTCKEVAKSELKLMEVFWKLMNQEELSEMASSQWVTLANHSATHVSFPSVTKNEMIEELSVCDHYLSEVNRDSVRAFAYPFGDYDQNSIRILQEEGIKHQFIADGTMKVPNGTIDRLVINPFISERNQLFAVKNGKY